MIGTGLPHAKSICHVLLLLGLTLVSFLAFAGYLPDSPVTILLTSTAEASMAKSSRIARLNVSGPIPWLCYYGEDRQVLKLPSYRLLILEADAIGPLAEEEKGERLCLAYLSIGEISQNRWFWPQVRNQPWLLEENPDWPGARRVNPASKDWQELLVNIIAPRLLAAGYDGFMLDNVDMGQYLEHMDSERFAGAKNAVVETIRALREKFPQAVIITNGGFETAAEAVGYIDAVLSESAFSRWTVGKNGEISYGPVAPQDRMWRYPWFLRFEEAGIPVLALEYVDPADSEARQRVYNEVKKAGYHPYIGERNLMDLPREGDIPTAQ